MSVPPKIKYCATDGFQKDLKRLLRKFKTLEEDLETVKKNAIELYHIKRLDNKSTFPIPDFCLKETQVLKIKKFACKSLKGRGARSGIRVIYAYHSSSAPTVKFIEIYFKGDKEKEDRERIKDYLNHFQLKK